MEAPERLREDPDAEAIGQRSAGMEWSGGDFLDLGVVNLFGARVEFTGPRVR